MRAERVLVLAPAGREGALACRGAVKRRARLRGAARHGGASARRCPAPGPPCSPRRRFSPPLGAARLKEALEAQPAWSDLPLILFVSRGRGAGYPGPPGRSGPRRNVTLLEKPVRPPTLITVMQGRPAGAGAAVRG